MKNTRFNREILITNRFINFQFIMDSENYREGYKIFSREGQFQFKDMDKVPEFLKMDEEFQKKLNDSISDTWEDEGTHSGETISWFTC